MGGWETENGPRRLFPETEIAELNRGSPLFTSLLVLSHYSHTTTFAASAPASCRPPAEPPTLSLAWVHPLRFSSGSWTRGGAVPGSPTAARGAYGTGLPQLETALLPGRCMERARNRRRSRSWARCATAIRLSRAVGSSAECPRCPRASLGSPRGRRALPGTIESAPSSSRRGPRLAQQPPLHGMQTRRVRKERQAAARAGVRLGAPGSCPQGRRMLAYGAPVVVASCPGLPSPAHRDLHSNRRTCPRCYYYTQRKTCTNWFLHHRQ